jgi:hypothetical protein
MHYVYVPFRDKAMDDFADALVAEKNRVNRFIGRHAKIERELGGKPLSVVGWHDRLYTLAHGAGRHSGVCVNTNPMNGASKYVTGEDFAALLIASGLKKTTLDVRLWTCWGGKSGTAEWSGPPGNQEHSLSSFALRVAQGFKTAGYKSVTVVGYRQLVNLSRKNLVDNGGHKMLQDTDEGDDIHFSRVSDENKVRYKVSAI